jgi:hypothetical protein
MTIVVSTGENMKTITITEKQWRDLNVGQLLQMAEYLHDNHSEGQTREEMVSERNDLNTAQFEYNKIREAFKA